MAIWRTSFHQESSASAPAFSAWPSLPRGFAAVLCLAVLLVVLMLVPARAAAQAPDKLAQANHCLDCHEAFDPPLQVTSAQFSEDIHAQKGLTCASCHGGDPTSDDPQVAMGKAAGFRGKIERSQIPALCSKCHSDAAYMHKYNPQLPTDQYSQYLTSMHGKMLARGDMRVAVCTDCHGVHPILAVKNSSAPVYPLHVAQTCAHCHADAAYMKPYKIPTDQFAGYTASVHYTDLTTGGDLSAPTCISCHGSHGAAAPGLSNVVAACENCHTVQAQLFEASPHKDAFQTIGSPACVTCHSNHRILQPTDAMIGTQKDAVCMNCHVEGDSGFQAAGHIHDQLVKLDSSITDAQSMLDRAQQAGVEVSAALLQQNEARDALTKARVALHSVNTATVDEDVTAGMNVSAKTLAAGRSALAEIGYRRRGLLFSIIAIFVVIIGLRLYIRQIESKR